MNPRRHSCARSTTPSRPRARALPPFAPPSAPALACSSTLAARRFGTAPPRRARPPRVLPRGRRRLASRRREDRLEPREEAGRRPTCPLRRGEEEARAPRRAQTRAPNPAAARRISTRSRSPLSHARWNGGHPGVVPRVARARGGRREERSRVARDAEATAWCSASCPSSSASDADAPSRSSRAEAASPAAHASWRRARARGRRRHRPEGAGRCALCAERLMRWRRAGWCARDRRYFAPLKRARERRIRSNGERRAVSGGGGSPTTDRSV